MENSRRKFLKIAGISVVGLGVKPVIDAVASDGTPKYAPNAEALRGKRWAMVVDTRKCKNDCTDCITACHTERLAQIGSLTHEEPSVRIQSKAISEPSKARKTSPTLMAVGSLVSM